MTAAGFKVATWNVNSLKARLQKVTDWLLKNDPDLLCLQETKLKDEAFGAYEEAFREVGYFSSHWGQGQWNGVALLSKKEPEQCLRGFLVKASCRSATEARLLTAFFEDLAVINVYVPNGREVGSEYYEDKLEFLDSLIRHVEMVRERAKVVLCGDFNVAPEPKDVWSEEALAGSTHITEAERERIKRLLQLGLVDAFRIRHPDEEGKFSWWDYRQGAFHKNEGLRIDLILLDEELKGSLIDCRIDRDARKNPSPSDHAPVIAELGI